MENFGERYVAEVKAEGKHLRLFSEFTITGPVALVWDIKAKQEILREMANDLNDGKEKCEECAKGLISKVPVIIWSRQP